MVESTDEEGCGFLDVCPCSAAQDRYEDRVTEDRQKHQFPGPQSCWFSLLSCEVALEFVVLFFFF